MKLFKRTRTKKLHSFFWFGVSSVAGILCLMYMMPLEIALVSIAVLFLHEFGHFAMAKLKGAEADWPLFIPLLFFVVGMTHITHLHKKDISAVALSGPIIGMIVSLVAFAIGILLGSSLVVLAAAWSFVFELFAATAGKDGSYAREWRSYMTTS